MVPQVPYWWGVIGDDDRPTDNVDHLGYNLPHLKQLFDVIDELWPDDEHARESIGGYSKAIHRRPATYLYSTPEAEIAAENLKARGVPNPSHAGLERETLRVMREWVPLLQFDPADAHYRCRILIRHDDLAACRVDKARSFTIFTE